VRREARGVVLIAALMAVLVIVGGSTDSVAHAATDWDNDTCLTCHNDPELSMQLESGEELELWIDASRWNDSIHAYWDMQCVQCHSSITATPHDPPSFSDSRGLATSASEECVLCHVDQREFQDSVHAEARNEGNDAAATCSDCHDPHYTADPPLTRDEIPNTCRTCHAEIYDEYEASAHGTALTEGNRDVPTCTDCHGVHDIEGPSNGTFHLFSPQLCAECHADEELMTKYGIRTDVFETYVADFHGRTITLFQEITPDQPTNAPVCVSCHGVHDIRHVDDSTSSVTKENLLSTCQQCHPDADTRFPDAWMSHYSASPQEWPLVFAVQTFYLVAIPIVIGGMLSYVAIDVFGRRRRKKEEEEEERRA